MQCPKCQSIDVSPVGTTHYICNNPNCNRNGKRTQFFVVPDTKVKFPYTQIFKNKTIDNFYKKQYLKIKNAGNMDL